jgi:hypothetical protein
MPPKARRPVECSARLRQPLDCLSDPIGAGLGLLALIDPAGVFIAMCKRQFLVRSLSCWIVGKRLGELGRLDNDPFLVVFDEFDLHLIARFHFELPEQVFAKTEVALTAIDHEPRAIFHTVDMGQDLRPLAAKSGGHLFGHYDGVAAALSS